MLGANALPAQADRFDDQIRTLKQQQNANQAEAQRLRGEANSLASEVAAFNAEISSAENQISVNQVLYEKAVNDIGKAEKDLTIKKQNLNDSLIEIYTEQSVTPIEILFSSGSFSEYINKQEYLDSLQTRITESIQQINDLKAKLVTERERTRGLVDQNKTLQADLNAKKSQKQQLLAETQGEESQYRSAIAKLDKDIQAAQAAQAASIAAVSDSVSFGGGTISGGSYPWANAGFPCSGSDQWGMCYRQCTSYAAWKRYSIGRPIPAWGKMGVAHAKYWVDWARTNPAPGMTVDRNPEVGALGVYTVGEYGHVMVVEEIRGNKVIVSNYNAGWTGQFSYNEWNVSDLWFIH